MSNKFYKSITLTEIINDDSLPPNPIIDDGILLDKTILMIVGPPKHKKTFLTQNFAISIISGEGFAGFNIPESKKVLYFLAEGGYYPNRERMKVMSQNLKSEHSDKMKLLLTSFIDLTEEEDFNEIKKEINEFGAEVVIFDPLSKFHSVEENSASAMSLVYSRIRELIESCNISVIIVHHSGKVVSRGSRGSNATHAEYDSCITLQSKNNITTLHYDMRHVETPSSTNIKFNSDTCRFELNDDEIINILTKEGGPLSKKEIVERVSGSKSNTYKKLKRLEKDKDILTENGIVKLADWKWKNNIQQKKD